MGSAAVSTAKRMRLGLIGVLLAPALALGSGAAEAKDGGGDLTVDGTVTFDELPCPTDDPDTLPCSATLSGEAAGELSGDHGTATWTATIAAATVSGTLDYGDLTGTDCATGAASGTVTITADDSHTTGTYDNATLPNLVGGFSATADFEWQRASDGLEISIRDAVIEILVANTGWVEVLSSGQGEGAARLVRGALTGLVDGCDAPTRTLVKTPIEGDVAFGEDRPPSTPTLLAPDDDTTFKFGEPHRFTVNATDPDHEPYRALITIVNATTGEVEDRFETRLVPSGVDSSGTPTHTIPVGAYVWFAEAIDARGASSGPTTDQHDFTVESAGPASTSSSPLPVSLP